MTINGAHHAVALAVVHLAGEGALEIVVSDEPVAAVDVIDQPRQHAGQAAGCGQRQHLHHAKHDAHGEVDGIVGDGGTRFGHAATPLTYEHQPEVQARDFGQTLACASGWCDSSTVCPVRAERYTASITSTDRRP